VTGPDKPPSRQGSDKRMNHCHGKEVTGPDQSPSRQGGDVRVNRCHIYKSNKR